MKTLAFVLVLTGLTLGAFAVPTETRAQDPDLARRLAQLELRVAALEGGGVAALDEEQAAENLAAARARWREARRELEQAEEALRDYRRKTSVLDAQAALTDHLKQVESTESRIEDYQSQIEGMDAEIQRILRELETLFTDVAEGDARLRKARSDLKALKGALTIYALRNGGEYPDDLQPLVERDENGHRYIDRNVLPEDPWGNAYRYEAPMLQKGPQLYTLGRDGAPGGEGEDADIHADDEGSEVAGNQTPNAERAALEQRGQRITSNRDQTVEAAAAWRRRLAEQKTRLAELFSVESRLGKLQREVEDAHRRDARAFDALLDAEDALNRR